MHRGQNDFGKRFDLVLGSEIFYDSTFLEDICQLLRELLNEGGTGLFCDPGRLGIEALEACFFKYFSISVKDVEVEWPRNLPKKRKKHSVLLYELVKRPSLFEPQ